MSDRRKGRKFEKYEGEIASLREELEKTISQLNTNLKFEKSTAIIDEILNYQRLLFDKCSHRYNKQRMKEDSTSLQQMGEGKNHNYTYVPNSCFKA